MTTPLLAPNKILRTNQSGDDYAIPVGQAKWLTIQTTLLSGTWTTAVLTLRRSLTGQSTDAVALETPVTITAKGIVTISVPPVPFIHITVTTVEGTTAEVAVYTHMTTTAA